MFSTTINFILIWTLQLATRKQEALSSEHFNGAAKQTHTHMQQQQFGEARTKSRPMVSMLEVQERPEEVNGSQPTEWMQTANASATPVTMSRSVPLNDSEANVSERGPQNGPESDRLMAWQLVQQHGPYAKWRRPELEQLRTKWTRPVNINIDSILLDFFFGVKAKFFSNYTRTI